MKKLVTSLIVVSILVGITLWWRGYVNGVVDVMERGIAETITALNDEDIDIGLEKIDAVREQWLQNESILALFLSHTLINGIDLCFVHTRSYIEQGGTTKALAELHTASHALQDMKRSMEISLRNIM